MGVIIGLNIRALTSNILRLCLDQGFGEEKGSGKGKGNGRWSSSSEQLDHLIFSFLSQNPRFKYSLQEYCVRRESQFGYENFNQGGDSINISKECF